MSKDDSEAPKGLRRLQETSAGSKIAKMATDVLGSTRRPQEAQNGYGCCSRPQEVLAGPKWQQLEPLFWDSFLTMLASPYSAQVLLFAVPLALTMVWARAVRVDSDTCSDIPGQSCGWVLLLGLCLAISGQVAVALSSMWRELDYELLQGMRPLAKLFQGLLNNDSGRAIRPFGPIAMEVEQGEQVFAVTACFMNSDRLYSWLHV